MATRKRSSILHNPSNMRALDEEYNTRSLRFAKQLIAQEEAKKKIAEARAIKLREKKHKKKTRASPPPPPEGGQGDTAEALAESSPPSPTPPTDGGGAEHAEDKAAAASRPQSKTDFRVALSLLQDIAPDDLCCPLSFSVYEDPVVTCDGHTYSRAEIERWFLRSDRSPITNEKLETQVVYPNLYLRSKVDDYIVARFSGLLS